EQPVYKILLRSGDLAHTSTPMDQTPLPASQPLSRPAKVSAAACLAVGRIEGPAYINPPEVMLAIRPTPPELQGYGHDDESSPPISSVRTSASLPFIQLAWKQLDNNEYAAVRATLTKGIEADRNSALAYSYRGFAWYLEGSTAKDPRDAYEAYRKGFPDLDMAIQLD